jgi:ABC-type uncharacterized transport system fused permease/ATPase subunit
VLGKFVFKDELFKDTITLFSAEANCVTHIFVFMCRINGFLLWIMLCLVMVKSTIACIYGDKFMGARECI